MEHSHHHPHTHHHEDVFHSHAPVGKMRSAFILTLCIFVIELLGGVWSHSLALLSDAGHVLTDLAALGLSWYALVQSERPSNRRMTFGYYRAGILAALVNGMTLIAVTVWILWEAVQRLQHVEPVTGPFVFVSAGAGLSVNLYLGLRMRYEENLNVQSAVLHMLGDAVASAGVMVGGVVMWITGWYVVDPVLSILIALLIAFGAWRLVRQTVIILMEGTPAEVDVDKVSAVICAVPGVHDVHDLHVWSLTSGMNALSCHVVMDGSLTVQQSQEILRDIEHRLVHMSIGHVTIQVEDPEHPHEPSLLCNAQTSGHRH
ncbi:CDF family zinc efflux transporter CzrB [Alicyclobacillus contaminans]|uniref:cation diffusion facilitator family transporter n=1 Tax=Alicyclobacillus contaminans TaxID=392016 RepID=UPI00041D51A0|nr:cation diffusion facilitator family transporter [Alicyclobacillus contaminans]GMA52203.1 CDF family zinc efflux transporter CzrB [Alicyclobacillus contaminans]